MQQIRRMLAADLPQVLNIEVICHEFPWTREMLQESIANDECFVMEDETNILGFYILRYVENQAEILDICIAPEYQNRKLGSELLSFLIDESRQKQIKEIFLEVRCSNFSAQGLYQKHGFQQTGVRKNYYQRKDGCEDALLMTLILK